MEVTTTEKKISLEKVCFFFYSSNFFLTHVLPMTCPVTPCSNRKEGSRLSLSPLNIDVSLVMSSLNC